MLGRICSGKKVLYKDANVIFTSKSRVIFRDTLFIFSSDWSVREYICLFTMSYDFVNLSDSSPP